jgi:hypothetical protein
MFVGVGEMAKDGERVFSRFSFAIRLQSFDDCMRSRRDALYYAAVHGSFETSLRETKREMVVISGLHVRIFDDQRIDEMVQAGPQAVHSLTRDDRKCWSGLNAESRQDVFGAIRVEVSDNSVAVNREILLEIGVEITLLAGF